ncbi:methylated-DNA--[protein]-cysteine S-methyltransferase [Desulfovibrio inopinatus]|uniref:methylated-DNA--[protein]-cysteine S-methyltransferase n=1 Tax=Desulfovibrio inopinatus TaxID=102109 RepID=UPI0003F9F967|nr:MGMT family protein [Desulfovibrio inopinatus]
MRDSETITAAPLGLTIEWHKDKIVHIELHYDDLPPEKYSTAEAYALRKALIAYVEGKLDQWPDLPFDFSIVPPFQTKALKQLCKVKPGTTVTYGELASMCGKPKGARAVGRAMATNPFPLVYPCHRVVGANDDLVGFGGGINLKKYLLDHEGALES